MNMLKKWLGIVWMLMAPVLIGFMCWQAWERIGAASPEVRSNTALQWIIILAVFIPVCIGFFLFGKFAWEGAYTHLPESSEEMEGE